MGFNKHNQVEVKIKARFRKVNPLRLEPITTDIEDCLYSFLFIVMLWGHL